MEQIKCYNCLEYPKYIRLNSGRFICGICGVPYITKDFLEFCKNEEYYEDIISDIQNGNLKVYEYLKNGIAREIKL